MLHYRMPQAHVGLAGWSLAPAWNLWVGVEELAEGAAPAAVRSRLRAAGTPGGVRSA